MKKNLYVVSAFIFILFIPGMQNSFAQRILQNWDKHLKAVPPANQYSAMAGYNSDGDAYWLVNTQDSESLKYSIHLVKYDTLGHLKFMNHYEGIGGLSMTDFLTLADGTTYSYGVDFGGGTGGTRDCFLQKNDPDGNVLWSAAFDPDPDQQENADQIYVSPVNGDIIVTAYETQPQYKLFLARYTSDGYPVWETSVPDYECGDIIVDPNDNIHLLGTYHYGTGADAIEFAYLKFDGNGNMLNYYQHIGGGSSHALNTAGKGKTIGLDNDGNVYALCWVETMPGSDTAYTHIMLNKFNTDGSLVWKKRLEWVKKGYPNEVATLLTDGTSGESIVIGGWGLWKYDTDGTFMSGWYDSRRNYYDACQYDQQKMFTISSGIRTIDGDSGKLAQFDWSDDHPELYQKGRGNIQPLNSTAIIVPDMVHNALYVTWSFNDSVSLHRVVLRNGVATGVNEISAPANGFQVYPNPANETTTISFSDNLNSSFVMDIYSAAGIRVMHKEFSHLASTSVDVKQLTPGIYEVVVASDGKQYRNKLVVIR